MVGTLVGWEDGCATGTLLGAEVGGVSVGSLVGNGMRLCIEGRWVGITVGWTVGVTVVATVGVTEG